MRCRGRGLRSRLVLGALALAVLAVAAAGLAVYGLARTQALAAEALAAQRRIEAYGALSSRVNEWMLGWLVPAGPPPDAAQVRQALAALEKLVAEDVAAAPTPAEAAERERQGVTPARIRAAGRRSWSARSAIRRAGRRRRTSPPITRRRCRRWWRRRCSRRSGGATRRWRRWRRCAGGCTGSRSGSGLAAPLVLAGLYLWLLRPLFGRLAAATEAAEALAAGAPAPGPGGHDELGLLLARVRRVAARVARDRARLNATVAERTAALSRANARLARIDAERRRFFADVGHELRTPLTVILGEAELGARHPDAGAARELRHHPRPGAASLPRIEDLLRIARSESGQLELERSPVDLAAVAAAALADAAPLLARAGVVPRADGLPPLVVAGDARLAAAGASAGSSRTPAKYAGRGATVAVAGRAEAGLAVVTVADDGRGPAAGAARGGLRPVRAAARRRRRRASGWALRSPGGWSRLTAAASGRRRRRRAACGW